jgi:signal-transduction protein with cAMP-binding, CBS, and nucleotidyltransferase domain
VGEQFYLIVQGAVSIRNKEGEVVAVLPTGVR